MKRSEERFGKKLFAFRNARRHTFPSSFRKTQIPSHEAIERLESFRVSEKDERLHKSSFYVDLIGLRWRKKRHFLQKKEHFQKIRYHVPVGIKEKAEKFRKIQKNSENLEKCSLMPDCKAEVSNRRLVACTWQKTLKRKHLKAFFAKMRKP